jgi:hypothetical protein
MFDCFLDDFGLFVALVAAENELPQVSRSLLDCFKTKYSGMYLGLKYNSV